MLNSCHCAVCSYSKGYLKGELGQLQWFIIVHLSFGQGHSFFSSKHEFIFALKDKILCKNSVSAFESCHSNVFITLYCRTRASLDCMLLSLMFIFHLPFCSMLTTQHLSYLFNLLPITWIILVIFWNVTKRNLRRFVHLVHNSREVSWSLCIHMNWPKNT